MTESNTPPTKAEDESTATERELKSEQTIEQSVQPSREHAKTPWLSIVAIVLVIALGAGMYYHGHQQASVQKAENATLRAELKTLHAAQTQEKLRIDTLLATQNKAISTEEQFQSAQSRQLKILEDKVASMSGNDVKTWSLAQADFLVKLAGRKLWSDQDATTAAALLKSADVSLMEMNDPSLLDIRRALTEDIASLAAVSQIDFDGIILKLNQLTNQLDNLRLADNSSDNTPMEQNSGDVSASLSEWRQNLTKSWHNFMSGFITVRRRDASAEPLLAPNQDIYLRENIRSRLLIAAQAVPRHQNEVYQQSLEVISSWVRAYYNTDDANTKAFLSEIDELRQQSINMDIPEQLKSQPLLEKLMQTRVRNLLAVPEQQVQTPAQGG